MHRGGSTINILATDIPLNYGYKNDSPNDLKAHLLHTANQIINLL